MAPVRLLPEATSADMRDTLEARVYDGLLLVGRQWQFGEHTADDAGSPAGVSMTVEQAALSSYRPGEGASVAYHQATAPLEALIESEQLDSLDARDYAQRIEAAQHFMRLLDAHGAGDCRRPYADFYAWSIASEDLAALDEDSRARLVFVAGRLPDPVALARELRQALGPAGDGPGDLPVAPELPASQRAAARLAAARWLGWLSAQGRDEPPAGEGVAVAWRMDRLEYAFAVHARSAGTGATLSVPEYAGGRLDWYTFRLGHPIAPDGLAEARTVTVETLPAPVVFRGMPADRFWQYEDTRVSWDALAIDRSAVATALLLQFALIHSPDWFVVPVELDVGSLSRMRSLVVTDTFGERQRIPHVSAVDGPASPWRLFTLATEPGAQPDDAAFLLAPTVSSALTGETVEDLVLLRDEQANLGWAVERLVERPAGGVLDRYEDYQRRLAARPEPPPAQAGVPRYRLGSEVPHHWIPLVLEESSPSTPATLLRRARIARPDVPAGPAGRLLRGADPFVLQAEEVPREGAHVTRAYRYARWSDGSTHLWVTRRKDPGRGEGSSGLRFDWLEPADGA